MQNFWGSKPTPPSLPSDEQAFFDNVVHNLRLRGWSKGEAEAEALERVERRRRPSAKPSGATASPGITSRDGGHGDDR